MMGIIGTSVIEVGTSANAAGNSPKVRANSPKVKSTSPKVTDSSHSQNDKTALWKKGPEKVFYNTTYFTITNLYNQKVLTAVEGTPASLDIKGKPKHTNLPVKVFADSSKSLYRHCTLIEIIWSN